MKTKIHLIILLIGFFLALPIISAYSFGGWGRGYYSSPMDFLRSEWVMFIIYFIFFFAIIYFTTNKSFKNPQVSAVVALALSLFIAMALGQRGFLDPYVSSGVASWALVIASLIAIGFSIKFAYETFGRIGSVAAIFIVWFVIYGINNSAEGPQGILPPELWNDYMLDAMAFIGSIWGLLILLLISAVVITARKRRGGSYAHDALDGLFGRN